MKEITITIKATVPDEATTDQLEYIAGTAYVQVAEPVGMEGDDLPWGGPTACDVSLTVEETS